MVEAITLERGLTHDTAFTEWGVKTAGLGTEKVEALKEMKEQGLFA